MSGLFNILAGWFRSESPALAPDYSRHIFTVETSEGEVYKIDTADRNSVFYGRVWAKFLAAYEDSDFIRGRTLACCLSRDSRFSGYTVSVEGIEGFLSASKASWFHDPEHDASGKCLASSVKSIYTSSAKAGKLIVNAYRPVRFLYGRQGRRNYQPGGTVYAIARDYDKSYLIFSYFKDNFVYVPMYAVVSLGTMCGLVSNPDMYTGLCFNLGITQRNGNNCLAEPLEVMTE